MQSNIFIFYFVNVYGFNFSSGFYLSPLHKRNLMWKCAFFGAFGPLYILLLFNLYMPQMHLVCVHLQIQNWQWSQAVSKELIQNFNNWSNIELNYTLNWHTMSWDNFSWLLLQNLLLFLRFCCLMLNSPDYIIPTVGKSSIEAAVFFSFMFLF